MKKSLPTSKHGETIITILNVIMRIIINKKIIHVFKKDNQLTAPTLSSLVRVLFKNSVVQDYLDQRCRSVFNIEGYNSAFLPFFWDFEIFGGEYSGFCRFFKFQWF